MLKLVRKILAPTVLLYLVVVKTRNFLFDKKIFKSEKVDAKVISVGNITVGGAGKTPTSIYISELLKENNIKVGVLSRGYKRKSKGYLLVSDEDTVLTGVKDAGDEILLIAKENKIPTAVSEKRVLGAKKFLNDVHLDAIVLDDGFQHRWIYRDIDILVIDQRFLNKVNKAEQNLLPLGNMREPFSSISRAGIVIINSKFSPKKGIPEQLKKYFKDKQIFWGSYKPAGIFDVKTKEQYTLEEFRGQKSLVISGIARPYSFLSVLENQDIDIKNKILFPDHKNYTLTDVQKIRKAFYETNSQSVLTTQKDAIKLTNYSKELDDIDIYYLRIALNIENNSIFHDLILNIFKN
ncbi:tetraacyldisaccharide 4'-kinase [bacterium BMS3Abin04]|nr:tetraacyldisaccharide 4'-kinase [bacterium BMS3Abin04]